MEVSPNGKNPVWAGNLYSDISGTKKFECGWNPNSQIESMVQPEAGPLLIFQEFTLNQCKAVEGEEHREMSASERSEKKS